MESSDTRGLPVLTGGLLREAIREVVARSLDLGRYELYVFGSEASGAADRSSDIDIGILGPQPVPAPKMEAIREQLEMLRTLRAFDLVDFTRVDESFKVKALEHAERL